MKLSLKKVEKVALRRELACMYIFLASIHFTARGSYRMEHDEKTTKRESDQLLNKVHRDGRLQQ